MPTLSDLQTRLARLDSVHSLRELFAAFGYEADFSPVFSRQDTKADECAQECLAEEPEIIARAGEFQIIYAPLREFEKRGLGSERLVISRLLEYYRLVEDAALRRQIQTVEAALRADGLPKKVRDELNALHKKKLAGEALWREAAKMYTRHDLKERAATTEEVEAWPQIVCSLALL